MIWYSRRYYFFYILYIIFIFLSCSLVEAKTGRLYGNLTACQHMRRAESRRGKSLGTKIRTPRCNKYGLFEQIQCQNEKRKRNCWCVDEYGVEIPETRASIRSKVKCKEPDHCPASACRMFCKSGFSRDPQTGCIQCRCRDPCKGVDCPNGQSCQLIEVKCKTEPCPAIPTCKKARSLAKFCPAGMPLVIDGIAGNKPYLCGLEAGKPKCPPVYRCVVEYGNDYGICCPNTIKFQKPGTCPPPENELYSESTGYMCGTPCNGDLECPDLDKCCITKGCNYNCQQPHNATKCLQARVLSDILAISDREGRGYVPACELESGLFKPRQCSRNGLVCWCVDPRSGHKITGTMGPANIVKCDNWEQLINRGSMSRSFHENKCDINICAAICEYGFKNDHNNCPTCECSEPCDNFQCGKGLHCEVVTDHLCESGSSLCASWPICKPNLPNSNPCATGIPLTHNITNEIIFCMAGSNNNIIDISHKLTQFYDNDTKDNGIRISCPTNYYCTKLHHDIQSVCCPITLEYNNDTTEISEVSEAFENKEYQQQTICEYLRDFSHRMEGTEKGMKLAVPSPRCSIDGQYTKRQCRFRTIKVTRAEQRKILEQNTIRRMKMLFINNKKKFYNNTQSNLNDYSESFMRFKRNVDRIKLYRVNDSLLKVQVDSPLTTLARNAKVIANRHQSTSNRHQSSGQLFNTDFKKIVPAPKRIINDNELIDLDVEECWCVDNFGTEIPRSRGFNVTDHQCQILRDSIKCLDLTCRMGCEYGFVLDEVTRCPTCHCRDPCQNVLCSEMEECRMVEVSCDNEYCPPVPACLPRKPGQCPYLVPPGSNNLDINACVYECRTDSQCDGKKRCCSNGCGTQCVLPQMKTACQHLQGIQMHQSFELGIPAMKIHVAQCDINSGKWNSIQCSPEGNCWCVDDIGQEISGTRVKHASPICGENSSYNCTNITCSLTCEFGFQTDENGCRTCKCRNFCDEINCAVNEECELITVECVLSPCPKMPICVPKRLSLCPEGSPLTEEGIEVSCGPHNENHTCPSTHTCQLNPVTNRGVCCAKTRDVCFESWNDSCLAKFASQYNVTRYRFNPKANRCLPVTIDIIDEKICPTKNLFPSEVACTTICPVLTQCERLKLKNTLAAHRTGHSSVWFQPKCDPLTGNWSPIQCLAKQPDLQTINHTHIDIIEPSIMKRVCWCADKKGAPLKGTLTRNEQPICNNRHGRQHKQLNASEIYIEELIKHMIMMTEVNNNFDFELSSDFIIITTQNSILDKREIDINNTLLNSSSMIEPIQVKVTRCRSLVDTAPFPVSCDEKGAFLSTQCNHKYCWCVDSAGNQLESSALFENGTYTCVYHPISKVIINLILHNTTNKPFTNSISENIRMELYQLLGANVENIRIEQSDDGSALVHFELHNDNMVDLAFAIEMLILSGEFKLAGDYYSTDITHSQFIHKRVEQPIYEEVVLSHEDNLQLILFIIATITALVICVFVIYIMVKRGQQKNNHPLSYLISHKSSMIGNHDLPLPIFVLNADKYLENIRSPSLVTKIKQVVY